MASGHGTFAKIEYTGDKSAKVLRAVAGEDANDPLGFLTYTGVALAVKILPAPKGWSRGR